MKPIALYITYAVIILKSAQRVVEPESFFKWTNCLKYDCYLVWMESLRE